MNIATLRTILVLSEFVMDCWFPSCKQSSRVVHFAKEVVNHSAFIRHGVVRPVFPSVRGPIENKRYAAQNATINLTPARTTWATSADASTQMTTR